MYVFLPIIESIDTWIFISSHKYFEKSIKLALFRIPQCPQNIEQISKFHTILIYFDDLCNCLYISITEMYVCICLSHFELFHCARVDNH